MTRSKWWRSLRGLPVPAQRQRPAMRFRPTVESLEDRITPSSNRTFVDDNWQDLSRSSGAPQVGDVIQNSNDTINRGGITASYGTTGFGTVLVGSTPGTASGAATINDAIANTNVGGTVNVLEGTYSEKVEVSKSLTLLGAQHGVDARTGRPGAAESVLNATNNSGQTLFDVTASNVTIDGFTVENETNSNVFGAGIRLAPGSSGSQVLNNIIENNIVGLFLANNSSTAQTIIQGNLFLNNNQSGPAGGNAIYTDQFVAGNTLTNVLIDSNTFTGNNNGGVLLGSTNGASPQSNLTISDNTFTNDGNGVFVGNATGVTIFRNTITASPGSQIVVAGGVNGLSIMQNFIDNGATNGVRIIVDSADGYTGVNQNIMINGNHIQGNVTAGLNLDSGAYSGTLDATNNFWGSLTGPTTSRNPTGTGDRIIDPDNVVQFVPFLNNGADAEPTTPGFQPSPNFGLPSISVAFGPAGEMLELVTPNGTLIQFDASGAHVFGGGVRSASVAFGPGGEELLVTFQNGQLFLFDAQGGHFLGAGVLSASIAFGPQGEVLEVVGLNGTLTQFDAQGAHALGGGVASVSVTFTKAGAEELLVTFPNGQLILFDAQGAHPQGGGVLSAGLAFDATGSEVLDVISQDGTLRQFDSAGVHTFGKVF